MVSILSALSRRGWLWDGGDLSSVAKRLFSLEDEGLVVLTLTDLELCGQLRRAEAAAKAASGKFTPEGPKHDAGERVRDRRGKRGGGCNQLALRKPRAKNRPHLDAAALGGAQEGRQASFLPTWCASVSAATMCCRGDCSGALPAACKRA